MTNPISSFFNGIFSFILLGIILGVLSINIFISNIKLRNKTINLEKKINKLVENEAAISRELIAARNEKDAAIRGKEFSDHEKKVAVSNLNASKKEIRGLKKQVKAKDKEVKNLDRENRSMVNSLEKEKGRVVKLDEKIKKQKSYFTNLKNDFKFLNDSLQESHKMVKYLDGEAVLLKDSLKYAYSEINDLTLQVHEARPYFNWKDFDFFSGLLGGSLLTILIISLYLFSNNKFKLTDLKIRTVREVNRSAA